MYEKVSQINYSCINFPTHVHTYSRPGWAGVLRKTYIIIKVSFIMESCPVSGVRLVMPIVSCAYQGRLSREGRRGNAPPKICSSCILNQVLGVTIVF